jgi:hypothetical protein
MPIRANAGHGARDPQSPVQHRPLFEIARDISADWNNISYAALPYRNAMQNMHNIHTSYGWDTGLEVVLKFLSNASHWRGPRAREIKAELRAICKEYQEKVGSFKEEYPAGILVPDTDKP